MPLSFYLLMPSCAASSITLPFLYFSFVFFVFFVVQVFFSPKRVSFLALTIAGIVVVAISVDFARRPDTY